jgi:hypothetical protein
MDGAGGKVVATIGGMKVRLPHADCGRASIVYNDAWAYTPGDSMSKVALTRTNLLLEVAKVRRLRRALQSRSNSEAVRRIIDERLATEAGLQALQDLRKLGGLEDVFGRIAPKS